MVESIGVAVVVAAEAAGAGPGETNNLLRAMRTAIDGQGCLPGGVLLVI